MLVIDNLTVEQVLTVPEVVDALEHAHKALSTGDRSMHPTTGYSRRVTARTMALNFQKAATPRTTLSRR